MSKKVLLVQYFLVSSDDEAYRQTRQAEIDACLVLNLKNPPLDEVHVLTERWTEFDFVPLEVRQHLHQVVVGRRLTYQMAIDYYNHTIPDSICILANADIFTDESLVILEHADFKTNIMALNRYEYNHDTKRSLMNGLEYNFNFPMLFPNWGPSIWTQDAWIWKSPHLRIDAAHSVDIPLGTTGCDNHFAHALKETGFLVYNPSFLVSINHYDRLSSEVSAKGIRKGRVSSVRDPAPPDAHKRRVYLPNADDLLDVFTTEASLEQSPPPNIHLHTLRQKKSIHLLPFIPSASSYEPSHPPIHGRWESAGAWRPAPDDPTPTFECEFSSATHVSIVDITGSPCAHDNDEAFGYVSNFRLSYFLNGGWHPLESLYDGIARPNGNFIKRTYLTPIFCKKLRIHCVDGERKSKPVTALKVRCFGTALHTMTVGEYTLTEYNTDWQTPVATEYSAYNYLKSRLPCNYFAFPWATLIDEPWVRKTNLRVLLEEHLRDSPLSPPSCTVVQHIRYKTLLPTFDALNIRTVFASHCTEAEQADFASKGIRLYPFSLFPVQASKGALVPFQERAYLASFVGQTNHKGFPSSLRETLVSTFSAHSDCFVKSRSQWHYQEVVFKGKGLEAIQTENEDEYRRVLQCSKLSLCPAGTGPNSIRIWESMSYGAIPVVLADALVLPPLHRSWNDAILVWKEEDLAGLYTHLKSIPSEELEAKSKVCIELYNTYFKEAVIGRTVVDTLQTSRSVAPI